MSIQVNRSDDDADERLPVVNSFTEWDPLEEVIVGRMDYAHIPQWHSTVQASVPQQHWEWFKKYGGRPFSQELLHAAAMELEELCNVLRAEGVIVQRPEPVDWSDTYMTPDFGPSRGLYGAMPRDFLLVIGNELIEAPMGWRSRYFEFRAYRTLIKDYFKRGAKWTAAPKPQLTDALYNEQFNDPRFTAMNSDRILTEFEPVFDAAEFARCGRDIFCGLSQVTNLFGVEWLQRHLGSDYQIHILEFERPLTMHIDANFVPLAPGRLLVSPHPPLKLPPMFRTWEIFHPPKPTIPDSHPLYFSSKWLSLNMLSLDKERIIVEKHEEPLIKFLKKIGFKPIPIAFRNFASVGGGFHCATCDIRRKGTLQSYF